MTGSAFGRNPSRALAVLLALATVVFAACGGGATASPAPATSTAAAASATPVSFAGQTLRVSATAGGMTDALKAGVGSFFEAKTGAKLVWVANDPQSAVSQLLAARGGPVPFDAIANMDSVSQARAISVDVIQKLDYANIPNAKAIPASGMRASGFGPGSYYYVVGQCYNTDKFKAAGLPAPTSTDVWFDPKLANHVAIPDSTQAMWNIAMPMFAKGLGLSATDPAPLIAKLKTIPGLRLAPNQTEIDSLLTNGDAWIAMDADGRCNAMTKKGLPFKLAPLGLTIDGKKYDYIAVTTGVEAVKGTQVKRLVEEFINLLLTPEGLVPLTKVLFYTAASSTVYDAQLKDPEVAPYLMPKTAALYAGDYGPWLSIEAKWIDAWNRGFKG